MAVTHLHCKLYCCRALESDDKSIQNVSPETDRRLALDAGRKNSTDTASLKSTSSQSSHSPTDHNLNCSEPEGTQSNVLVLREAKGYKVGRGSYKALTGGSNSLVEEINQ